jgi:hypothetical protein
MSNSFADFLARLRGEDAKPAQSAAGDPATACGWSLARVGGGKGRTGISSAKQLW